LCVDDHATGLLVRKLFLEAQHYEVLTAGNGRDALAVFSEEPVDLVVLDYAMPEMDGGEVAQKMREIKPAVPILMLSAFVDLPSETLALVDKSVVKGDPPPVLLDAIGKLLDKH